MKRTTTGWSILGLVSVLTAYRLSRRTGFFNARVFISRRGLIKVTGLGLTALVTGAWTKRSSPSAAPAGRLSPAVTCVLTPEQTEGPYYIPKEKVRSNITEHRPGTPLKLRINVVDASTCKPIKGAAVDVWHCDAGGIYSGFMSASVGGQPGGSGGPTDKRTFLRGIQLTDARGYCEFQTIYPGWYRGRTVHIHVKVHLGATVGHVVHTGQLYFSDSLTAKVYQSAAYKARAAARDTFNNTDSIFLNGGRQSMLTMKRDGHIGYIGSITLGVRRS
jgi:protocatechuate 3,4-dioxygenase beta subunit